MIILQKLNLIVRSIGINLNYLVFISLSFLMILFLSFNIYKTIKRGEANYMTKLEEQTKREKLMAEGKVLDEKIEYYNSLDSKRNIAISTYKLSEPGENLYRIEDENSNMQIIEQENLDPINLEDNRFWWKVVLGLD